MCGAVLNALNTRLDPASMAFMLDHGEAKALIVDREFSEVIGAALKLAKARLLVIDYDDPGYDGPGERLGGLDYEDLIAEGAEAFERTAPGDEWDAIALNYTSGTTGDPKGVVYHHRGANLLSAGNILTVRCRPPPCLPVDAADVPLQWLVFPLVDQRESRRTCLLAAGAG